MNQESKNNDFKTETEIFNIEIKTKARSKVTIQTMRARKIARIRVSSRFKEKVFARIGI